MTPRPHVRVPNALQFDEDLPRGARDLWILLDDTCREYAGAELSRQYLCHALRCSPASLKRWRAALVDAGWLDWWPGEGRGEIPLWVPLHRARAVTNRSARPVDNSVGRGSEGAQKGLRRGSNWTPSDQGKGLTGEPLKGSPYKDPAHEEHKRARDPWCGRCDERTRLLDDDTRDVVVRCPSCHPDTAPLF